MAQVRAVVPEDIDLGWHGNQLRFRLGKMHVDLLLTGTVLRAGVPVALQLVNAAIRELREQARPHGQD